MRLPATIQPFETLYYTSGGTTSRRLRARVESANGVGYYMNGGRLDHRLRRGDGPPLIPSVAATFPTYSLTIF